MSTYKTLKEWREIFELDNLFSNAFVENNNEFFTKEEIEIALFETYSVADIENINKDNPVIQICKVHDGDSWRAYDDIDQALNHYRTEVIDNKNLDATIEITYMRKKTFYQLPEYQG